MVLNEEIKRTFYLEFYNAKHLSKNKISTGCQNHQEFISSRLDLEIKCKEVIYIEENDP